VVSASLNPTRFVDLQLGHWGFTPNAGETFLTMYNRLATNILAWWNSDDNGIKDNGITGINRLNTDFTPLASQDIYYFTMSFDATRPFPQLNLSGNDLREIPLHPVVSSLKGIPWVADAAALASAVSHEIFSSFPGNPSDVDIAKWAVKVINNRASELGYQFRLPSPGGRIPRADMLPILSIFSLGMSGVNAPFGPSEQNDGVVDTVSMRGPANTQIQDAVIFNTAAITANRGVYWDFGVTEGIDHADQVGVFTVDSTVSILRVFFLIESVLAGR